MVEWKSNAVLRSLYTHGTADSIKLAGDVEKFRMEQVQAYIGIRGSANFQSVPRWYLFETVADNLR